MKAVLLTKYGEPEVLQVGEIELPEPKDKEIRVQVLASSVGYGDLLARRFRYVSRKEFRMPAILGLATRFLFGFRHPKIRVLGASFAGRVDAIGAKVTRFRLGDEVFGYRGPLFGANAEYLCTSEEGLVALKPKAMTFEEASCVPYGALTAMTILERLEIRPGKKVLILGASGGIGSFAVQIAKDFGAEVTGVCSTPKIELVRWLGADHVLDYTKEDFTQKETKYDLIVDIVGSVPFARSQRALTEKGVHFYVSFKTPQLLQMLWTRLRGGKRVCCGFSSETAAALERIKEKVEAGRLKVKLDKSFPLQAAAEAHRYLEAGQAVGHVALRMEGKNR